VAVDWSVVKIYGLRAYVLSSVDAGEILAIYDLRSRNMKFLEWFWVGALTSL
jgi:hypothetical protein